MPDKVKMLTLLQYILSIRVEEESLHPSWFRNKWEKRIRIHSIYNTGDSTIKVVLKDIDIKITKKFVDLFTLVDNRRKIGHFINKSNQ